MKVRDWRGIHLSMWKASATRAREPTAYPVMQDKCIASVVFEIAEVKQLDGTRENEGVHGPTTISTKKKMISRTSRNVILAERDGAMFGGSGTRMEARGLGTSG